MNINEMKWLEWKSFCMKHPLNGLRTWLWRKTKAGSMLRILPHFLSWGWSLCCLLTTTLTASASCSSTADWSAGSILHSDTRALEQWTLEESHGSSFLSFHTLIWTGNFSLQICHSLSTTEGGSKGRRTRNSKAVNLVHDSQYRFYTRLLVITTQ